MLKFSRKKAAIAGAIAAFVLAMTAGAAFAAPVLQPGVTSYPGMSGTCTDCHTYAKAATTTAPKAKAKAKAKKTAISHPYVSKRKHRVGITFAVWGFISPRLHNANEATLTINVQQYAGHGSWVATSGLETTGTVSQSGKFKHKTNYTAAMNITQAGSYRMRTKLIWTDAKGVERTRWSKLCYCRVFK